jgi:flagellar basal body-associated protein FliL
MKPGDFEVNFDGSSLSAIISVQPSLSMKIALYLLNILLIAVIVLFTVGGVGVIVLFIVAFEILFLRYSIWNLHGTETIVLTKETLSYQQFYGFFKLGIKSFKINKTIRIIPFHENFQAGNKAMKLIFESYDSDDEPVNLYQTALVISRPDYELFMKAFHQQYTK